MSAKFTPGPYQRDGRFVFKLVDNPEPRQDWPHKVNKWMASVQPCGEAIDTAELEAVATLFQAAPLLYEALEELYALVDGECPSLLDEDKGGDARLDMAINTALRAARGEE